MTPHPTQGPEEDAPSAATSSAESTGSMHDVPRPHDNIQVQFELDTGQLYWWPATVLEVEEPSKPGTVKGSARVLYAARHTMKEEEGTIYFLGESMVTCDEGDTRWRTSADAADAGEGNADERNWESTRPPRRLQRQEGICGKRARTNEQDEIVERHEPRRRQDRGPARRRKRGSSSTRLLQVPVHTRGRSVMDDVLLRMHVLEGRVADVGVCRHTDLVEDIVGEKRMVWKTRVLLELGRSVREVQPRNDRPFSAVVQSQNIRITDDTSYATFCRVVSAMARNSSLNKPHGIRFWPSFDALSNPEMEVREGHVMFESAGAMLRWLGVTSQRDFRTALDKHQVLRKV